MFDNLLEDLQALGTAEVGRATLDELEELCRNPVFILLCDYCRRTCPEDPK